MNGAIRLWDLHTHEEIAVIRPGHDDEYRPGHRNYCCMSMAVSGRIIASSFRDTVFIVDAHTHEELFEFHGHTDDVTSVAFDCSGRFIASGSEDKTIRIWDTVTHEEIAVLRGHRDFVLSVVFSEIGGNIASGSHDNTVRLWDALLHTELAVFRGHTAPVCDVAFCRNGKLIASGSVDASVRLWDAFSHENVAILKGHTQAVLAIVFDVSGRYIASSSGLVLGESDQTSSDEDLADGLPHASLSHQSVRVWDTNLLQDLTQAGDEDNMNDNDDHFDSDALYEINEIYSTYKTHAETVMALAFDTSGKFLASGSKDAIIRLWDTSTQQEMSTFKGHTQSVRSVVFDASGKFLASGSKDATIRLWDTSTQQEMATFKGHTQSVRSVVFDASGKFLASGSKDATIRLWDTSTQQEMATFTCDSAVNTIAIDGSGRYLASGHEDGCICLWLFAYFPTQEKNEPVILHPPDPTHAHCFRFKKSCVNSVAFDSSGRYLAVGATRAHPKSCFTVWDVIERRRVASHSGFDFDVNCVAWSGSFILLCSAGSRHKSSDVLDSLRIWNFDSQKEIVSLRGHTLRVNAVAIHDGGYIASGMAGHLRSLIAIANN
jgi:WD40 repeat protein